jgi:hypothetical protein
VPSYLFLRYGPGGRPDTHRTVRRRPILRVQRWADVENPAEWALIALRDAFDLVAASVAGDPRNCPGRANSRWYGMMETIILAGYKFTVRANRDILFEAPYQPVSTGVVPRGDSHEKLTHPGASR